MELRFLGGAREVGRSAVLVNDSLLLDFGMLADNPPRFPVETPDPDAVVASHGHLDHVGAVPSLLSGRSRPPIHWTPPTYELALTLARDTLKLHGVSASGARGGSKRRRRFGGTLQCPFTENDVKRVTEVSRTHGYGVPFEAAGHQITFFNAGHIPGSAHVLVDDGETRLLYTGDFHTDDQRLVAETTARPDADVVICESTYADVTHEERAAVERRWTERVRTTIWEGGTVVAPVFAIGRTQELMLVSGANDLTPYVDGMGREVTRLVRRHPEFLRDPEALRDAAGAARFVSGGDGQRERIAADNALILTTSGMLTGGPVHAYLPEIRGDPTNTVTLTGYQVEGTPGRELQEHGRLAIRGQIRPVSARVESFDFSAHADRGGLESFLDAYRDAEVLVVHGDRCESFAEDLRMNGYAATAPELGERKHTNGTDLDHS